MIGALWQSQSLLPGLKKPAVACNSQSAHETMEHTTNDHKRSYGQVDESTSEEDFY